MDTAKKEACEEGIERGIELGKILEKIEMAKTMLQRSFEIEVICQMIGLTEEMILQ